MLIKFLLQVSRERRRLSFVVFICLLFLSCWLGFLVYNFVMGVWTRLLPWLEPPYLFLIVICMIFLVININNEKVEINYVTKYEYVSSFDSKDSKDDSTPSEKRSFSTSSTTSSSLRVRAEVNEKVEDYIKEVHMKWKCERQMDDSPWESPIRSPPPIHKMGMGKHQEGKKYREAFDEALVSLAHEQTLKKLSKTAASFNDEWWKAIIDGLFYETEIRYTKTQIKDCLSKLYSKWKAWNKVMNTPGFDWDPVGKTIRANDNNWTSYIKVNPESTKIRASTFPMYEELTTIFNSIDAASLESFTTSPRVNTNPNFNASHDLSDSSDCRSSSSGNNSIKTNNKGVTGNLHKLRRTGDFKPSDIGSSELLEVVKVLVELVKHKDRASARPTSDASSVSITACVKMLQEMEGVNNQSTSKFFFKAIDMFQSPGWREAFVAMTVDQRLRWLNNLKCV